MILLRNAVVWVLSFLLIMPPQWVLAADPIVIDTSAPGQNQAALAATPSGKTLLNIVAPNASGVSHNKFTDFNVTSSGLVINNATALATTHLAGVIEANPNFSGTAASLILNEVTSSNRSTLNGPTEIGGQAADYILANPNGITCNGCGFINTPRATLTTGTPTFTGNALTGLSVNAGDVVIEGLGLDATQADKFDIVTRATSINAQINAKDLGIHTGRQDFDYVARSGTAKVDDGSTKPTFAIDSTALGGMYAGRITLVGTEAGLGVRVAGDMAASTADMILTSDGKLELKSNLSAATTIQLTSTAADIVADKDVYAAGALTATASAGTVTASAGASFGAAGNVTVQAANVTAGTGGKFVSGMDGTGTLTTGGALDVQATTQISTGDGFLGGGASVFIKAPTVDLSRAADDNSETVRSRGTLTIESGNLTATNGRIASDGAMTLKGNSPIVLGAGLYQSVTTINLTGDSVTSAATIVSDDQINITSTVGDITNTGSMTAGTTAALNSAANVSNSGTIESQTGTTVTAAGTLTNASGAKIKSATTTSVTTGGTLTNAGSIYAVNTATLIAPTIDNSGSIAGGTNLDINVATLTNLNGVLHAQNNFTVTGYNGAANAVLFDNASGYVETATGDITINADTITNRRSAFTTSAGVVWSGMAPESSCAQLDYFGYCLRSFYTLSTPIGTYNLNDWKGYGGIPGYMTAGYVTSNSAAGQISSGRNATLSGTTIGNDKSTISAVGDIAITTTTLNNEAVSLYKDVYATRGVTFLVAREAGDTVDSVIQAGGNLTVTAAGGVRNGSEQVFSAPPAGPLQVDINILATVPTPSGLLDTSQYTDLIPGRDALFVTSADPTAKFLFETRVDFITVANYFGSDYFLSKLDVTPEQISNRIGDAFFETELVRQAILQETGRRWLDSTVKDDIQQMKTLLDNGAQATNDLQLAFGVTLTAAQINALTSDIVIYVEETYQGRTVLVPKVYLASASRAKLDSRGAIITGDNVTIDATSIANDFSTLEADTDLTLTASGDITSSSGKIKAGNDIALTSTAGAVTVETHVDQFNSGGNITSFQNQRANVTAGGKLTVAANTTLSILGADVSAGGDASLTAIGDLTVGTVELRRAATFDRASVNETKHIGSTLSAGGKLNITSGGDALIQGSTASATGDLNVQATGSVVVESSTDTYQQSEWGRGGKGLSRGKVSGSLEINKTTQNVSKLTAGGDLTLGALTGNLSIISSELDSGGDLTLNTPNGTLYLGARKDLVDIRDTRSKTGLMTYAATNRGSIDETVVPTLLTANGNIAIVTGNGIVVDYKDTGDFNQSIDQLSQAPGLAWMADLRGRNDVTWNAVQEVHESWDYSSQGLSGTGAMIVALAVAAATSGMGAELVGYVTEGSAQVAAAGTASASAGGTLTVGSTFTVGTGMTASTLTVASTTTVAVMDTAFTALVSRAVTSTLNHSGDLTAVLKDLGSSANIRALATSMITAGLMEGLPMDKLGLDASKTAPFVEKLKYNIATASISATVDSVVNGTPLTENLKHGLVNAAVTVVGAEAAHMISEAASDASNINPNSASGVKVTQLVAHAALGCAMGAANGDCASGAIGGAVGEAAAMAHAAITADQLQADLDQLKSTNLTDAQRRAVAENMYADWLARGVDVAKVTGALAAAVGGADANGINIAAGTAQNAAENNFIWMIPVILVGLELVDKALMVKDAYDLAEAVKNDDQEQIKELSISLGIGLATDGVPGNVIVAKAVLKLKKSGASSAVINKVKTLFGGTVPVTEMRRTELLMSVSDPTLKNRIDKLYRQDSVYGDGGTADAIRHELQTGELLSPSGHSQKGQEMINGLSKDINSGRLSADEINIAKALRDDLQNALDGN